MSFAFSANGMITSYQTVHEVLLLLVLFSFARGHKQLSAVVVRFHERRNQCLGCRRFKSLHVGTQPSN
jgi:hypothetical protein